MNALSNGGFGWTMNDEREFIRGLGTHRRESPHVLATWPSRAQILRGYIEGLDVRDEWGQLNPEDLRAFALEELLREEGKVA